MNERERENRGGKRMEGEGGERERGMLQCVERGVGY